MDDWEYVTIHRSDGFWKPLERHDMEAAVDLDELLAALEAEGWERAQGSETYTGSELERVRMRHHLSPA